MNAFTTSQLTGIAAAIDARDRELRDELEQSGKKRYLDLAGSVHDTGDEAAATELIDMQHALIQRHLFELREIEVARGRLAAGTIDECEERLMANPVAVRCIGCQGRFESNRPHEARSSM